MQDRQHALSEALEQMQAFQGRVVAQVSGHPKYAMHAAFKESNGASQSQSWWQGAAHLGAAAAREFLGKLRVTLLGRPSARAIIQKWVEEEERKLVLARGVWFGDHPKSPSDRQWLQSIDTSVLSVLIDKGFLHDMPAIKEADEQTFVAGPLARQRPGALPQIVMASDYQGEVGTFLKSAAAPSAYARWFLLLHEASHCEFSGIRNPFRPTSNELNEKQLVAFNDWVFSPLGGGHARHTTVLNEGFADCYASMMLLEATDHDPGVASMLHEMCGNRRQDRLTSEAGMSGAVKEYDAMGPSARFDYPKEQIGGNHPSFDVHATDFAISRMLEEVGSWRGKSPQELRSLALGYASDGFMDLIQPDRLDQEYGRIGYFLRQGVKNPMSFWYGANNYSGVLDFVISACVYGKSDTDRMEWLEGQLKGHPAHDFVKQVWSAVTPGVNEHIQLFGQTFVSDVENFKPRSIFGNKDIIVATLKVYVDTPAGLEGASNVELHRRAGQAIIARALATPPSPKPIELPACDDWRARRKMTSAATGCPSPTLPGAGLGRR